MRQNKRHKTSGPANPHAFAHGFRSQPGHLSCAVEQFPMTTTSKTCTKCQRVRLASEFYSHRFSADGLGYICRACIRVSRRDYYQLHKAQCRTSSRRHYRKHAAEYKARSKAVCTTPAAKARAAVKYAKSRGRLIPQPCVDCGRMTDRQEAHHEDYEKRLDVVWLCGVCHYARHRPETECCNSVTAD